MSLEFLPGKRFVFHKRASQEEQPAGDNGQFTPAITSFFGLEAKLRPAEALFAELDRRFRWPAADIRSPDRH
jgi:hypothetical protein